MSEKLNTWVSVPENSDFTIYNLPYGIYSQQGGSPKVGVAIGESVLDLDALQKAGCQDLYNLKGGILAWARDIDPTIPQY